VDGGEDEMKIAILEAMRKLVIRDVQKPVLDKDEVLIKVQYCGVCGSNLHIYVEGIGIGLGHEFSGDVVDLGSEVDGWKIGDRVAVNPRIPCGECYWCIRGEIGLCDKLFLSAIRGQGAFATYAKAKYVQLYKLPDELTYEEGTMVEPTACALHAIRLSSVKVGDVVAVLGLGPIGLLVAQLAKISGAKAVYGTEISPSRIELAQNVVDLVIHPKIANPVDRILDLTGGMGPDVVFECAGSVETIQDSIVLVRRGGTIIIPGMCFEAVETSFIDVVLKGLTLRGSLAWSAGEYAVALELIKNRMIDVNPLITDKFPLEDINRAFDKALKGEGGKILVKP
jgi:(R,R)-butanediol dehydrogenase/meso-butanediol dehydrogenase/diacetyl reductase